MNWFDLVIVVTAVIAAISGYKEGFIMEMASLAGIILGILLGFKLMGLAMVWLAGEFNIDQKVLPFLAFGLVFVIVVIVVNLAGKSLKSLVNKGFLGTVDGAAGAFIGIFKAVFMISVVLWLIDSLKFSLPQNWTDQSLTYEYIHSIAPQTARALGALVPFFEDVF